MNKNQSMIYPTMEIDWETKKAFFLPIFLEICVTNGMTKKVVINAPTQPKRVGHKPAPEPSNK